MYSYVYSCMYIYIYIYICVCVGELSTPSPSSSRQKIIKKLEAASLLNTIERPVTRKQIINLENNLLQQVKDIMEDITVSSTHITIASQLSSPSSMNSLESPMSPPMSSTNSPEDKNITGMVPKRFFPPSPKHPSKSLIKKPLDVKFILNKNKIMEEFDVTTEDLIKKPWMDRLIRADNLFLINDDIAMRFSDMVTVQTAELGGLMRKLRRTYKQNFQQMRISWNELHEIYKESVHALHISEENNRYLQMKMETQEKDIVSRLGMHT